MDTTIQEAGTNGATANVVPTTIATPPAKLPTYEATKSAAMKVSNKEWKRVSATLEMGAETGQDYHIDGIKVPSGTLVLPKRVTLDGTILQVQIVTVTGLKPHLLYCVPAAIIPVRNSTRHSTQGNVNRVMSATESAMIDAARKLGPGSFPTAAKNIGKPALTQKDATKEEFHAMYPGMTQRNFAEWLVVLHKHRTAMLAELETALNTPGTDIAAALRAYTSPSNIERLYTSMASGTGMLEDGYVRPSDEAIKAAHAVPVTAPTDLDIIDGTLKNAETLKRFEKYAVFNQVARDYADRPAVLQHIESLKSSDARYIMEAAGYSNPDMPQEAVQALIDQLSSEDEAIRQAAVDATYALYVPETYPGYVAPLTDAEQEAIVKAAQDALAPVETENGDLIEAGSMIARKNGRKNGK